MAFLLDTLRKNLGSGNEEGFGDLNYIIGNTSGLDIGQVPSPLDQRIGRMAQIGGGVMEVQITNPATFQIDRPELMNVINQIGFDTITLHGDPNIGFTGAYATRGQGITGYNIVHRYFKRYLEQMASFRWEASKQKEDFFDVGYVNMHASNEMIPAREERLASDVSVDPFGFQITNINGGKEINIYENEEFLENLFDYFFLEMVEQPWRQYEQIFSDESEDFREKWNEVKAEEVDDYFFSRKMDISFKDKISLFQTASSIDQGAEEDFLQSLDQYELEQPIEIAARRTTQEDELGEEVVRKVSTLEEISNVFRAEARRIFSNTARLSRDLFDLKNGNVQPELERGIRATGINVPENSLDNAVEELIEDLWGTGTQAALSAQGKLQSVSRNLDIQNTRIYEEAQDRPDVIEEAKKAFSNPENNQIIKNLTQGRVRDDFNKESSLFFHILPAWMQAADYSSDEGNHPGWEVPKFIWENTLRQSVEESNVVDGDDPYFDSWEQFEAFLDERRENELDVIAAVGICYIWGHWTQKKDRFNNEPFELTVTGFEGYEKPELKEGDEGSYTWIEWMNKFGLRLNIEAMFGSPGELRRVWRPKDIAIACHAINRQARKDLGEDYDNNLVKFTIDMEHTASYGVDPWNEMQKLIDNEKKLAEDYPDLGINPEKPLAKIVKTYHLTKPGWEQQQGHRHGPFTRGDETLYYWLYHMVKNGFARNPDDEARIIFEVGGEYREEMYVTRVAMDMIELGIEPEELNVNKIPVDGNFETVEQELMARFFGMDKGSFNREWAKIEEHAFDPLDGLLQARSFDDTFSSQGAIEQGQARPQQWKEEEYQ